MTQMTITIDRESFTQTGVSQLGDIEGTVDLTLGRETRRVRALKVEKYGWLFAYGIEGRYNTGNKWWGGSVRSEADGKIYVQFGRYDNHPKFNKTNVRFKD
jgi:hypothetical protein